MTTTSTGPTAEQVLDASRPVNPDTQAYLEGKRAERKAAEQARRNRAAEAAEQAKQAARDAARRVCPDCGLSAADCWVLAEDAAAVGCGPTAAQADDEGYRDGYYNAARNGEFYGPWREVYEASYRQGRAGRDGRPEDRFSRRTEPAPAGGGGLRAIGEDIAAEVVRVGRLQ